MFTIDDRLRKEIAEHADTVRRLNDVRKSLAVCERERSAALHDIDYFLADMQLLKDRYNAQSSELSEKDKDLDEARWAAEELRDEFTNRHSWPLPWELGQEVQGQNSSLSFECHQSSSDRSAFDSCN
jgi:seryl-tRNA synthetase